MAEAICGPSNALQQFKQQTQHDRSLQQDRFAARHQPAQGFRSANPNVGHLDPEFEAFQAGVPLANFPQQYLGPALQKPHFSQQSQQPPSWAADFSQMSLSSPPPPPFVQQAWQPVSDGANWAHELASHTSTVAPRAQHMASASPQAFQQTARFGPAAFRSAMTQPSFAPMMQGKGKAAAKEQFDDAAFEHAFDQAREAMMTDVEATLGLQEQVMPEAAMEEEVKVSEDITHQPAPRGKDQATGLQGNGTNVWLIPEESQEEMQRPDESSEEDDALAATAQDLLEKVENNQTDKFRNSQFLGLMRRLRDREVTVRGDKMVESSALPSASTPVFNQSSYIRPRFSNTEQTPAPVDSRPVDHGIPLQEQDHDSGAFSPFIQTDGHDVAALLDEPGLPGGELDPSPAGTREDDIDSEFHMTSPFYQP